MSETKFTKGEWCCVFGNTYSCVRIKSKVIADLRTINNMYNKHDAHLISAAPDMYALLEKLVSVEHERGGSLGSDGEFNYKVGESVFKEAKSLLLKVRGEL